MAYCDCKHCEKFKGDCGNHFIDKNGHTDFNIPKESVLDRYNVPTCFVNTRTKYKELHDRMSKEGLFAFRFPDSEDWDNVLRALLIADKDEISKR